MNKDIVPSPKRDMSWNSEGVGASDGVGMRIAIKRFGNRVQISLRCHGDYQAMELYDRLVKAAEKGEVISI